MNDDDWLKKRKRGPRGGCATLALVALLGVNGLQSCVEPPSVGDEGGGPGGGPPGGGPPGGAPGGAGAGGQPGGQGGGAGAAEDLVNSWATELAVEVPALSTGTDCVDQDGDGFVSALACPGADPATLDCDDADPAVTPATERWVPPGPFLMGSASTQAGRDEQPVHVVQVSGFCLDVHEVTAADFGAWLKASGRKAEGTDLRSMDAAGKVEAGREAHPAEGVTWTEAAAYCEAAGKALPTEAQWEKAARGGCELGSASGFCDAADLRAYPWGGAVPSCALANHQLSAGGKPSLCVSDTVVVDSQPEGAGPYGHLHLAGNVWEHVSDAWNPATYASAVTRTDPGGPADGDVHVLRGGSWNTFSTNMRAANRFSDLVAGSAAGLRCARPTVDAVPDEVPPLVLVSLSGTITRQTGELVGRTVTVSAFDARDADASGRLSPGRSSVMDAVFAAEGEELAFTLKVPAGAEYLISAALDDGTGADKAGYTAASGSGGVGQASQNPVKAEADVDGLTIVLKPKAAGGQAGMGGGGGQAGMGGQAGGQAGMGGQAGGQAGMGGAGGKAGGQAGMGGAGAQAGGQGGAIGADGKPAGTPPTEGGAERPPGLPPGTPPPQHGGGTQ